MKIALDSTPLIVPTGGTPRYVTELRRALERSFPQDEYAFASDQPIERQAEWPRHWQSPPPPSSLLSRKWWLFGLPLYLRHHRFDLFHGTDYSVPYLPACASVLSLLDLSPWLDAAWHRGAGRVRNRTPILLRFQVPTMVLTLSDAVRREAITMFRLRPDRIVAVPLAANDLFRPVEAVAAEPYFLYVGTLEPRKNLPLLVNAWREVRKKHPIRLLLIGRRREDGPLFPPEPGLEIRSGVPDSELPALYSAAIAVVYPTLYEGFGLPVLEAMQCGAPVITSMDTAVTEVAAGAALQVNAGDAAGWLNAMLSVIENPDLRAELRQKGLRRAKSFSWENTATKTHEVYMEAIHRFRRDR